MHAILKHLTPFEWMEHRDQFRGRAFYKDILTSLPVELVLLISQNLDVHETVTLRRVSASHQILPNDLKPLQDPSTLDVDVF